MYKYNHAFIVSRFQPFHNGHKALVDKMLKESKNCTIILGTAQESRTEKNPFTPDERIFMVKNIYGNLPNLNIFCVDDIRNDDEWYKYILKNIEAKSSNFGRPEAFYCGKSEEADWFNNGELKIEVLDRTKQNNTLKISGTEIRNMIKNNNPTWKKFIPEKNIDFIKNILKHN